MNKVQFRFSGYNIRRIKMTNGKDYLMQDNYLFFIHYKGKKWTTWKCTRYPTCKSFIYIDSYSDEIIVYKSFIDHKHFPAKYVKTINGLYAKICDG